MPCCARRPTVALVDELAHTNAPGSRNAKRYQDVEELLQAGIHVISTLNIQHLESLYDMIESCTGVKVKERVPDYVLGQADQIVNVDLSAEDLQERLPAARSTRRSASSSALSNFFTEANLSRLREMALEEIRHLLDRRRQDRTARPDVPGSDRVMVCLSRAAPTPCGCCARGPAGRPSHCAVVRGVHPTPARRLERIDAATQRRISDALTLAHAAGRHALNYEGPTFDEAVADFVREYSITHVVVGRSQRPWYRRWSASRRWTGSCGRCRKWM